MSQGHSRGLQRGVTNRMRSKLHGLTVACPLNQCNPDDCALSGIRKKALQERFSWVESLTEDEVVEILENHSVCLRTKEEAEEKAHFAPPGSGKPPGLVGTGI